MDGWAFKFFNTIESSSIIWLTIFQSKKSNTNRIKREKNLHYMLVI
jgi:hypothetical protein